MRWHKPFLVGALTKLRKVTISFVMFVFPSARVEQLGYQCSDFRESSFLSFFLGGGSLSRKCKFDSNLTRIMDILREDLCTFMISLSALLG